MPAARRLFLTGRRISASEAVAINLLTEAVPESTLDEAVDREVEMILQCAPGALAASKRLIEYVSAHTVADNLIYTVDRVAEMWAWEEAAEGIKSFVEKRRPSWSNEKTRADRRDRYAVAPVIAGLPAGRHFRNGRMIFQIALDHLAQRVAREFLEKNYRG